MKELPQWHTVRRDFQRRRSAIAGLALTAAPIAFVGVYSAYARAKQTEPDKSLYERLGGVFAIAEVMDHFPIVGQKSKNPQLREWHANNLKMHPASSS